MLSAVSPDHEPDVAFRWIHSITEATMELYFEKILKIPHLSHQSARQLSTDIGMDVFENKYLLYLSDWVVSM